MGKPTLILFSVILALFFAEGILQLLQLTNAWKHISLHQSNLMETSLVKTSSCNLGNSQISHPFLGYVYRRNTNCENFHVNNIGLNHHRDMPAERDENFFSILVLGGSVATQLTLGENQISWIEEYLNKFYFSPNGKPFRIISGSLNGWVMPQQVIMTSLYGNRVDAIIAVEGYNEALGISGGLPIEAMIASSYLYSLKSWRDTRFIVGVYAARGILLAAQMIPALFQSLVVRLGFNTIMGFLNHYLYASYPGNPVYDNYPIFHEIPQTWTESERTNWKIKEYIRYIRANSALTNSYGVKYVHFIQPIPMIDKPLTEEERMIQAFFPPSLYYDILTAAKKLNREKINVVDLTNVFHNQKETIYGDHVHCKWNSMGKNPGYRIMARRITEELANLWKLKVKNPKENYSKTRL